jgi:hypothetical protein
MIFMPFPRFVVPTSAPPPFRHNEGRVNEAFFFIECTSVAKFVGDIRRASDEGGGARASYPAIFEPSGFAVTRKPGPRKRECINDQYAASSLLNDAHPAPI